MDFTTVKFLCFLGLVAVLNRLLPARFRGLLLVASSYCFYWMWSGRMSLALFCATLTAWLAGRAIGRFRGENSRRGVAFGVVAGLVLLMALFKALPLLGTLSGGSFVMPLGISYYSFKLISYVIDVYQNKFQAEREFVVFAAWVSFFPQIVAGPIQRGDSFLPQMRVDRRVRFVDTIAGVQRILLGYFKKFVVADNLSLIVNFIYGHVYDAGTPLILAYYAYPLQIYADFSGLTDIAIGSARLLGVETPENFNAPFSAPNPAEYWRRWHITLTTWLTDYVFTPLRMSTRALGQAGLVLSLTINMVLIGIWHGFRWSFALFGMVHAIYLSVDALTARRRRKYYKTHLVADRLTSWTGPVLTFHLVAIAFVFFRGRDLGSIFYFLGHLSSGVLHGSDQFEALISSSGRSILTGAGGYFIMEAADYFRRHDRQGEKVARLPRWGRWSLYSCTALTATFALLLLLAGGGNQNPFLYAIF